LTAQEEKKNILIAQEGLHREMAELQANPTLQKVFANA
jgi:hypothetical protein